MERVKRRSSSTFPSSAPDEAAISKAAAWAWYQHGSGSDSRCTTREFDLGNPRRGGFLRTRRPSRYKQEALAAAAAAEDNEEEHCGATVPLLDLYEIERITRELERFISASDVGGRGREDEDGAGAAPSTADASRKVGGPWAGHAAGICSSSGSMRSTAAVSRAAMRVGGPWARHAARICSSGAVQSAACASRAARKMGGPWGRHAAGMCFSAEDAVEKAVTVVGRRLGRAATVASKIRCDRIT